MDSGAAWKTDLLKLSEVNPVFLFQLFLNVVHNRKKNTTWC